MKLQEEEDDEACRPCLPRPKGRGPIEAKDLAAILLAQGHLPRPKGRGPIEAIMSSTRRTGAAAFRGRKVAAPLKRAD